MRHTIALLVSAAALTAAGCSKDPAPDAESAAPTKPEPAAAAPALPRTAAPEGARTFIIAPEDGATVSSPFTVEFGAENITVIAAGDNTPGSGHHHLLINAPLPDFGLPIPKSDQYVHFGGGQTETELALEPGPYELQLLFGDHLHIPHDPPVYSEVVTITVE
ncbi:MAG: DUF4399 domain-containing protein [Pseudomonadota bacterium]